MAICFFLDKCLKIITIMAIYNIFFFLYLTVLHVVIITASIWSPQMYRTIFYHMYHGMTSQYAIVEG